MASVKAALADKVKSFAGITALVGMRVYHRLAPQGSILPFITFFKVDGPRIHDMEGFSGLSFPRFQFDIFAKNALEAENISAQLKLCLDGFRGIVTGVNIQCIRLLDDDDGYDEGPEINRISHDYQVWHQE